MKKQLRNEILILIGVGATYLLATKYRKIATVAMVAGRFLLSLNDKNNSAGELVNVNEDQSTEGAVKPLVTKAYAPEQELH